MRIILSHEAQGDLFALEHYIAEHEGVVRANMVLERIGKTINTLAYMPRMGRIRHNLKDVWLFPAPPWIIVYEPLPELDGISILRILDGRRDLPSIVDS